MTTATNCSVSIQKHDDDGILVSAEGSDLSDQKANPFVSVSNRLPEKLMTVLDSGVYSHIFSWTKSGRSISIYKPYDLVSDVLTTHFDAKSDMKFDSFLRKLYRWGFSKRKIEEEEFDENGQLYYHELFQRGKPELLKKIKCNTKPSTKRVRTRIVNSSSFNSIPSTMTDANLMQLQMQQQMMMGGLQNQNTYLDMLQQPSLLNQVSPDYSNVLMQQYQNQQAMLQGMNNMQHHNLFDQASLAAQMSNNGAVSNLYSDVSLGGNMSQMSSYNQVHGLNGMMPQPMTSVTSMKSQHLNQTQGQFLNHQHSGSLNNVSENSSLANSQLPKTEFSGTYDSSCQSRNFKKRNFQAIDSDGIDDDRKEKFMLNACNNPSA